jgi:hypothetical protein
METLTREEIEMCEMAVAIVTDTRDLTDDNKAKWDALWNKLERMQKVDSKIPSQTNRTVLVYNIRSRAACETDGSSKLDVN